MYIVEFKKGIINGQCCYIDFWDIESIYVDDEELEFLIDTFNTLPFYNSKKGTYRAYGDIAKTIGGNL